MATFQGSVDTAANWAAANRVPLLDEYCFERDTNKLKIGDGTTAYNSLAYISGVGGAGAIDDTLPRATTTTLSALNTRSNLPSGSATRVNNVMNYGAKGDNSTDDTTAVQNAINAGGVTEFPGGNYIVTNLTLASGTILRGINPGGVGVIPTAAHRSCLRRPDGSSGHWITIPQGAGAGIIEDLELDARLQPGDAIHVDDYGPGEEAQWKLHRLYIHDTIITTGSGFTDGDGVHVGANRRALTARQVYVYHCGRYGIYVGGSDSEWHSCSSASNGWDGVVVVNGAARFVGGNYYGNGGSAVSVATVNVSSVSATGNPTTITTSTAHGLTTGMRAYITGVVGPTSVNMAWPVTVVDATHFTIAISNVVAYVSGGTVRGYANAFWQRAAEDVSLLGVGIDRSQFSGIFCEPACGKISIVGCMLTTNSQASDATWANIEVNSQNANVTIIGNLFGNQVSGITNKPIAHVITRNSSAWYDFGNVGSTSTSNVTSGTYTNFVRGLRPITVDQAAPGTAFIVSSTDSGATWQFNSATVSARPTARTDLTMMAVTNGTTLPSFAISGDLLLKVP